MKLDAPRPCPLKQPVVNGKAKLLAALLVFLFAAARRLQNQVVENPDQLDGRRRQRSMRKRFLGSALQTRGSFLARAFPAMQRRLAIARAARCRANTSAAGIPNSAYPRYTSAAIPSSANPRYTSAAAIPSSANPRYTSAAAIPSSANPRSASATSAAAILSSANPRSASIPSSANPPSNGIPRSPLPVGAAIGRRCGGRRRGKAALVLADEELAGYSVIPADKAHQKGNEAVGGFLAAAEPEGARVNGVQRRHEVLDEHPIHGRENRGGGVAGKQRRGDPPGEFVGSPGSAAGAQGAYHRVHGVAQGLVAARAQKLHWDCAKARVVRGGAGGKNCGCRQQERQGFDLRSHLATSIEHCAALFYNPGVWALRCRLF